jgi:LPS export ABC transporter protein LptC
MRNAKGACLLFCILFGAGCSLDYREAQQSEVMLESVPDVVFRRFVHIAVNGEIMVFRLEAREARLFNKKKMTVLSDVRFIEYDDAGASAIEGRAREAVFHTDTENAELSGDVYGYSVADKVGFYADQLVWLKDDRILKSTGGATVRIKKDDGSFIEGSYFAVDARRKSLTYNAAVRGTYFHENDETNVK